MNTAITKVNVSLHQDNHTVLFESGNAIVCKMHVPPMVNIQVQYSLTNRMCATVLV